MPVANDLVLLIHLVLAEFYRCKAQLSVAGFNQLEQKQAGG